MLVRSFEVGISQGFAGRSLSSHDVLDELPGRSTVEPNIHGIRTLPECPPTVAQVRRDELVDLVRPPVVCPLLLQDSDDVRERFR